VRRAMMGVARCVRSPGYDAGVRRGAERSREVRRGEERSEAPETPE
jgi:hypothetical protein